MPSPVTLAALELCPSICASRQTGGRQPLTRLHRFESAGPGNWPNEHLLVGRTAHDRMVDREHDGLVRATRVTTTSSEAFCIDRESTYLVENRTPHDIQIDRDAQRLIVPGLATRRMSGIRLHVFESELIPLRQRHQLRVTRHHETPVWSTLFGLAALFALMALPIMMIVRFLQDGTFLRSLTAVLLGATLVIGLSAISAWFIAEHRRTRQRELDERADGDVAHGSSALLEPDTGMGRRIWNFAVLLVMITVGVLLPATWIYFGTELHEIVSFENGLSIGEGSAAEATWRSIQITYVAVLVTLPAMLYFLFDRVHINGLIHQWSRDIFRLDRRVETLADMQARYGHKLAEATRQSPSSTRLVGSKRSPIIVATLLFSVGWTLLILPTGSRRHNRRGHFRGVRGRRRARGAGGARRRANERSRGAGSGCGRGRGSRRPCTGRCGASDRRHPRGTIERQLGCRCDE